MESRNPDLRHLLGQMRSRNLTPFRPLKYIIGMGCGVAWAWGPPRGHWVGRNALWPSLLTLYPRHLSKRGVRFLTALHQSLGIPVLRHLHGMRQEFENEIWPLVFSSEPVLWCQLCSEKGRTYAKLALILRCEAFSCG